MDREQKLKVIKVLFETVKVPKEFYNHPAIIETCIELYNPKNISISYNNGTLKFCGGTFTLKHGKYKIRKDGGYFGNYRINQYKDRYNEYGMVISSEVNGTCYGPWNNGITYQDNYERKDGYIVLNDDKNFYLDCGDVNFQLGQYRYFSLYDVFGKKREINIQEFNEIYQRNKMFAIRNYPHLAEYYQYLEEEIYNNMKQKSSSR